MKIQEVRDRNKPLPDQLIRIWERSVKATHLFLSEEEIANIKTFVPQALQQVPAQVVAEDDTGRLTGFMGIADGHLEMLFVDDEARGKGTGRQLLSWGIREYGVRTLAVNEQNPQAQGFYEHMGFEVYKRTDHDEQGNPWPLLYMELAD